MSNLFSGILDQLGDEDPREGQEDAVKSLLGSEDIDVSGMSNEELQALLAKQTYSIGSLMGESSSPEEIIEVMKEAGAKENDILEALHIHAGLHLHEAKEIYRDIIREKR
jgi:hypothetical protein